MKNIRIHMYIPDNASHTGNADDGTERKVHSFNLTPA